MFKRNVTNFVFRPGKMSMLMDGGAGSSGKGKVGSFITHHADNWQFCCNTFFPQAGHTIVLDNGKKYFYQTLNSCAYQDSYEKMYIGPGSIIELPALLREIEENNLNERRLGISPVVAVLSSLDTDYERGIRDLDGNLLGKVGDGTMKHGSTAHGVGACLAKKILRKDNVVLARDIEVLKPFLCDVSDEIITRLKNGQAGFLEIAQGFQLSLNYDKFYPYSTSRNCTVAQGFSDMFLPIKFAGPLILNFRTFPIRINNKKFIGFDGNHLTWDEVQSGVPCTVYEGNSGPCYPDQNEITWEEVTELSGSKESIFEITSVTKLPRRVFTFSKQNLSESIKYNMTGSDLYISLNFANYVDVFMNKRSGQDGHFGRNSSMTPKFEKWVNKNVGEFSSFIRFIGTGPSLSDMII